MFINKFSLHGAVCILAFVAVISSCRRSASEYVAKGNQFFERDKFADASLNYRKAIQLEPTLGDAYYRLAMSSLKENNPADVLPNLTRAVELAPKLEIAREKLADLLITLYLNNQSRSKALYDQLVGLADKCLEKDADSYVGHRIRGYLAFVESKPGEALEHFQKAEQQRPAEPEPELMLAQCLFLLGRPEEGERRARALVESHPDYAPGYDLLSKYLESHKRYADSEALLQAKRRKNPKQAAYAMQLAEFYLRRGDLARQNAVLQDVAGNPNYSDGALLVGDFEVQTGDWKNALEAMQKGLHAHPERASAYLKRLAVILVDHQDARRALNLVEQYLPSNSKDLDLKALRARLIIDARAGSKIPLAISELLELEMTSPKNPDLHFQLGRALSMQGKLNEAHREFSEAVKLNGRFLEPRLSLILMSSYSGNYYDALRKCDEVLAIAPGQPRALVFRAASLSALGRYDEARATLKSLRAISGETAGVAVEDAFLSVAEKKYAPAEKVFRQYYKLGDDDLRPLAGLVSALEGQGKWDAAVNLVSKDLSANPQRPFVHLMLAQVKAEKDLGGAVQELESLVAANPQFSPGLLALGESYLRRGEPQKAIAPLDQAKKLNPESQAPLMLLSKALEGVNEMQKAKSVYQDWLKLDPDNPVALNNLAYIESETGGDLDEGLRLALHALRKSPKDANISDTIGWIYLKKRMYGSAETVFQSLCQRYPKNTVFRFHHGLAYLESGNKPKAKLELEAALSGQASGELVQKVREAMDRVNSR